MERDTPYGWVVVFAAFMSHCLTHGVVYSYGILFVSLRDAFNGTKAELGWIMSITTGSLYLSGPLASILCRRLGNRTVAIIGTCIVSFGFILTMFSFHLYFMYFSLGFLTGLGNGLIFIPCVVDVTMRFDKYRALACGTAVAGAGFGAFVIGPLIKILLDEYAWRGTLLIIAAILLNCIPCAMALSGREAFTKHTQDSSSLIRKTRKKNEKIINEDERISLKPVDSNTNALNNSSDTFLDNERTIDKINNDTETNVIIIEYNDEQRIYNDPGFSQNKKDEAIRKATKERCIETETDAPNKHCCSELPFFKLLKRKEMLLFYSSQFLFINGLYQPFVFLPEMAIGYGLSHQSAVWLIQTIGISTVIGRVVLGYLSDRKLMSRVLLYKIALLIAGVSTAVVPVLTSFELLICYTVIYGLSTAVMLSQTTVVLVEIVGMETMADAMGLNNMFSGFGALMGPPLLGLTYDKTGSYLPSFLIAGLGMVLGSVMLCLLPFVSRRHRI